jgi:hypothetical protein
MSEAEFDSGDYLKLDEFLEALRFESCGSLSWYGDYIKGRRLKTCLEIKSDGSFRLEAHSRGHAPLRWIETLRGNSQSLRSVTNKEKEPSNLI